MSQFYDGQDHVDWDAVANTTYSLGDNSTLYATPEEYTMTALDVIYYLLSFLAFVGFCFCTRSRIPDERYRIIAAERRARYLAREERVERMTDPNYRENLVMQALVIKKVTDEKDGQLTLDDVDEEDDDCSSGAGSISIDSNDENVSTCVICLEAFRVGDIVAWSKTFLDHTSQDSRTQICNHVFHRECIVSWLMRPNEMHDHCPSCRSTIVHEEVQDGADDDDDDDSVDQDRLPDQYATTAFVIMHGLVSRVRRASYSLIGQNISIDGEDFADEDDIEAGGVISPKPSPSPMRRVISLEGTAARRRSSLRRRPSSGSILSGRSSVAGSVADGSINSGDEDDDNSQKSSSKPPKPPSVLPRGSPLILRRVVSDLTRTPTLPLSREPSLGGSRRFPLPLRPRGTAYQRVSSAGDDHSERSVSEGSISEHSISEISISERSLFEDEEDIVIRHVSTRDTTAISQSLSDPTDEEEAVPCN